MIKGACLAIAQGHPITAQTYRTISEDVARRLQEIKPRRAQLGRLYRHAQRCHTPASWLDMAVYRVVSLWAHAREGDEP
jgi:hypothetical protein